MAVAGEKEYIADDKMGMEHRPSEAENHIMERKGLSRPLMGASLISYLAALSFGYNNAIIGSTLGQANFFAYFPELLTASNGGSLIGAIVALISAGGAVGVLINAWINDAYGRRAGFLAHGIFTIIGVGLISGSVNIPMMCVGRAIQGIGAWGSINGAVVYVQELAPSGFRGEFGAGVGPSLIVGYIIAAWIQVGCSYYTDAFNWRLPLLLGAIWPILLCIAVFFVPETPRWLIWHNRSEQAMEVFRKFHADPKDPDHLLAREEHYQVSRQVELDRTLPSSWWAMLTRYWRRSWAAALCTFNNQISGIQVITNYGVTIYAAAGMGGSLPLIINAVWLVWAGMASAFWASQVDRVGRKNLFVWNSILTAATFAIVIGLYAVYVENAATASNLLAGQRALIFSFFPYVFFYEMGEPTIFLYIGEIFPTHIRAKGVAVGLFSLNVTATWVTMAFPDGLAAGGWKFFLLFLFLLIICAGLQMIFLKESRHISLEEMAVIWGHPEEVAIFSKDIRHRMVGENEHVPA